MSLDAVILQFSISRTVDAVAQWLKFWATGQKVMSLNSWTPGVALDKGVINVNVS